MTAWSPPVGRAGGGSQHPLRPTLGRWLPPMLPALLLLLLFLGPIVWCLYISFTDAALTGASASSTSFVGLDNFSRMLDDPELGKAIWLTVVFVVGSAVIGQNTLGLAIALLMSGRHRATRVVVGTAVVSAWVLPEIVAAFTWYAFLGRDGTLNAGLGALGLPEQEWLFSVPIVAVVLANIWRGTAFSMLVYSAALSDVPSEITEAAQVDGAGGWRRLVYVTLPLIKHSIVTNLMLITLQTLSVFTLIFVMTGGGPGTKSQTLPLLMYQQAFKFSDLGYGTAIALVLLLVGAVFSLVYTRALRPEVR